MAHWVKVNEPDELDRTPLSWAAEMGHKAVMMTLLREPGNKAKITEEILKAAIRNSENGKELVTLLLEYTDGVVKAAAENFGSGKEVMKLLLDRRGGEVKITDEIVEAAVGRSGSGKEVIEPAFQPSHPLQKLALGVEWRAPDYWQGEEWRTKGMSLAGLDG